MVAAVLCIRVLSCVWCVLRRMDRQKQNTQARTNVARAWGDAPQWRHNSYVHKFRSRSPHGATCLERVCISCHTCVTPVYGTTVDHFSVGSSKKRSFRATPVGRRSMAIPWQAPISQKKDFLNDKWYRALSSTSIHSKWWTKDEGHNRACWLVVGRTRQSFDSPCGDWEKLEGCLCWEESAAITGSNIDDHGMNNSLPLKMNWNV